MNATNTQSTSEQTLAEEREILREEKEILQEIKKEEHMIARLASNVWFLTILVSIALVGAAGVFAYETLTGGRITTDRAQISAPHIDLAPQTAGTLEKVLVREGDQVGANAVVAEVGNELIKTKAAGVIISSKEDIGKLFNRGEAVVSMIDPNELRLVGKIKEDEGLADIRVGQRVAFTVDAFGSKEYEGVVDGISPVSRESGVAFSISDKRETKEFDIKVRFDIVKYPELKDGMSAEMTIFVK